MWLMSENGFYSVIANKYQDNLVVRSRIKEDLENLGISDSNIIFEPHRDYKYRAFLPKGSFIDLVSKMIHDIDYHNFKDRIYEKNPHRAMIYSYLWETLLDIEEEEFLDKDCS